MRKCGTAEEPELLCPSAEPGMVGSVAFGVVGGTAEEPRVRHLEQPVPVTDDLLALSGPVSPTEVFRFAARCACHACPNFKHERCSLAARIVTLLPTVTDDLPICPIRPRCRWWREEGREACRRCPQVVTDNVNPSEEMRVASDPASSL